MRAFDRDLIRGIMAGDHVPHSKVERMAALINAALVKKATP
jgi:hypothetical protein